MNKQFARDVSEGLSSLPKRLSSKYFYDEEGDRIFQAIMAMPEYYLTRSEFEILEANKKKLLELFRGEGGQFNLIEFGAGDGLKTKILLRYFCEQGADFQYIPVDISASVLNLLVKDLEKNLPSLKVKSLQGDYFQALGKLKNTTAGKNIVLFLGSNIGNFSEEEAISFLRKMGGNLKKGDMILIGFDLKKDPERISSAYNDRAGITRAFNLNLLKRINRELGGEFDLDKFQHYQMYDPVSGEARSFLMSRQQQEVHIKALGQTFKFGAWEPVHVEISRKYDITTIERYAVESGYTICCSFLDCRHFYTDTLWECK